jgi:RNA polymerase sigma factor (sigma-70 family)
VRVHPRWSRIVHEDGPEPYVRKTILHQYLSWRRRLSNSEIPSPDLPDRPQPLLPDEDLLERDEMWSLLVTLPRVQRAVVVLRHYEDLADADIAGLLGCTTATVRVHAFKALKRLRTALTPLPATGNRHD